MLRFDQIDDGLDLNLGTAGEDEGLRVCRCEEDGCLSADPSFAWAGYEDLIIVSMREELRCFWIRTCFPCDLGSKLGYNFVTSGSGRYKCQ